MAASDKAFGHYFDTKNNGSAAMIALISPDSGPRIGVMFSIDPPQREYGRSICKSKDISHTCLILRNG